MTGSNPAADPADERSSLGRQTEFRELLARLDLQERAAQQTIQAEGREDWSRRARLTRWVIVERVRAAGAEASLPAELGELLTALDRYETGEQFSMAEALRVLIVEYLQRRTDR